MNDSTLNFSNLEALGRAFRVETASVWAEISDHVRFTRTGVGSLIAFQGSASSEYLVGILDRVTRDLYEESFSDDDPLGRQYVEQRPRDLARVILVGTYRTVEGQRVNTFKRGADSYPLVDSLCWVIEGENLQRLMGLLSDQLDHDKRLTLGKFVVDPKAVAVADGDRLFQRHAALVGSTGSGKSWAVALILERAKALAYPNLIVFDMHGEYAPLCTGNDPIARYFRIAGPGDSGPQEGLLYLPWWMLNQEEMQALLLDRSEDNAPNQAARLTQHVRDLKQERLHSEGHIELANRFTVDSPVPYDLSELIGRLEKDDSDMIPGSSGRLKQGPFHGRLTRFINRFRGRIEDRRYNFMFNPPDDHNRYEWLHELSKQLLGTSRGIKVIDFSEVPSDVLPIVVGVLARVLYEIQLWTEERQRTPFTFVCDEAHLYLPSTGVNVVESRALDIFERIAKEGRKYGLSLLVVSQRPSDVSRTVLSQCNNFIALRLTNDQDKTAIKRLTPDNMEGLTAALPLLDIGEALILGDSIILPTRIRLDPPRVKPASATRNFWTEWNERPVEEDNLEKAVEALRFQARS